jgi:protein-L-isoaspartate(D-aspartate) O-methyltransferase
LSASFAAQRANMVESQVRTADVTDHAIQDAMRAVPRESLLPTDTAYLAYADVEVEYAPGRWLLKPRDVAKLLQALRPRPKERALAIAAPYAAAVLERIGLSVERCDAGDLGAAAGRYELAICEGAVAEIPPGWLEALAHPGGRLGAVQRKGPVARGVMVVRTEASFGRLDLFDCGPPYMAGFEPRRSFVF